MGGSLARNVPSRPKTGSRPSSRFAGREQQVWCLYSVKGLHDWSHPLLSTEKVLANCWSHVPYPDTTDAKRSKILRAANSGLDKARLALH